MGEPTRVWSVLSGLAFRPPCETGRSPRWKFGFLTAHLGTLHKQGIDEMACSLKFVWQPCRYTIDRSKAVLKLYRGNVYTITQKWHTRGEKHCEVTCNLHEVQIGQTLRTKNPSFITATARYKNSLQLSKTAKRYRPSATTSRRRPYQRIARTPAIPVSRLFIGYPSSQVGFADKHSMSSNYHLFLSRQ